MQYLRTATHLLSWRSQMESALEVEIRLHWGNCTESWWCMGSVQREEQTYSPYDFLLYKFFHFLVFIFCWLQPTAEGGFLWAPLQWDCTAVSVWKSSVRDVEMCLESKEKLIRKIKTSGSWSWRRYGRFDAFYISDALVYKVERRNGWIKPLKYVSSSLPAFRASLKGLCTNLIPWRTNREFGLRKTRLLSEQRGSRTSLTWKANAIFMLMLGSE